MGYLRTKDVKGGGIVSDGRRFVKGVPYVLARSYKSRTANSNTPDKRDGWEARYRSKNAARAARKDRSA